MNDYRVVKTMSFNKPFIAIIVAIALAFGLYYIKQLADKIYIDEHNYHCKKGRLYMSVTPNSHVFKQTTEYCLDIRDEPLITEVK